MFGVKLRPFMGIVVTILLFSTSSGCILDSDDDPSSTKSITYYTLIVSDGTGLIEITDVNSSEDLGCYRLVIIKDGIETATLDPIESGEFGDIEYHDRDEDGKLTPGDWIIFDLENEIIA